MKKILYVITRYNVWFIISGILMISMATISLIPEQNLNLESTITLGTGTILFALLGIAQILVNASIFHSSEFYIIPRKNLDAFRKKNNME